MELSKKEKTLITNELCLTGASKYQSAFFDTKQYKNLRNYLLDEVESEEISIPHLRLCGLSKIKEDGKKVIAKHTNGIDIKVPYSYADSLITEVEARFGLNPPAEEFQNIARFIKNNYDVLKVTDIPVYTMTDANEDGYINASTFYDLNLQEYKELFKILPYVVTEIGLTGTLTEKNKATYVHEMYHILSQRNRGYTNNLLHDEVLSIFMERVAMLDLHPELINYKILERILSIKNHAISVEGIKNGIIEDDLRKEQKYIISTLLATSLFNTYHQSNNKIKNEMDNDVNNILTGLTTLEDILDKYEATEEKGAQLTKKQIKNHKK